MQPAADTNSQVLTTENGNNTGMKNQKFQFSGMLVQHFRGAYVADTWPLFQFLNLYTVGRTPWTGDQPVARPLPTQRKTQTE
jgi:hypothetical protein